MTNKIAAQQPRKTAAWVGILYIVGTVAGVLGAICINDIVNAPNFLSAVAAQENRIVLGAMLVLAMGLALAIIPILMYPLLKKHNEKLALGYVVFRGALETVTYFMTFLGFLLLLPLARAFMQAGAPAEGIYTTLGALLRGISELPLTLFVFCIGALIFYAALYQSRLIPRWITVWGFAAIALHLATGFLIVFGVTSSFFTPVVAMNFPIFLQELVMAVWMIVKGFNTQNVQL